MKMKTVDRIELNTEKEIAIQKTINGKSTGDQLTRNGDQNNYKNV